LWDGLAGYDASFSYDVWASCAGTNIGAALREGSNALLLPRTRRTEGSVWVMVLLSDGAAGASDPVGNNSPDPNTPNTLPDPSDYPYTRSGETPPFRVTYGGFGLCPAGSPGNSELVDLSEVPYGFPFCTDEIPETRHFCFNPEDNTPNQIDVRNGGFPNCEMLYDPDDYARDWADFVTGIRSTTGGASQSGLSQLPTIFTIGFGLTFRYDTARCMNGSIQHDPTYSANTSQSDIPDCLGEELLRYVADVGDNFQLDSDYQQAYRDNLQPDVLPDPEDYGTRGPCEEGDELLAVPPEAASDIYQLILPKPAGESCGNYFNAPGGEELEKVFDEITSRMFTRLTR
jgi:hypothetical protein